MGLQSGEWKAMREGRRVLDAEGLEMVEVEREQEVSDGQQVSCRSRPDGSCEAERR